MERALLIIENTLVKKIRNGRIIFLLALFTCSAGLQAQIAWTNAAGSTAWYTATNWTPNTGSGAWLVTDWAQFNNTGTAVTAGINMNTSLLSIGGIEVTNLRTRNLTIGNSSSAVSGLLTLNGTTINAASNVILRNASANLFTLQDNDVGSGKIMDILLGNVTDNIVYIDGSGNISISSIITGTGKNLTLAGTGSGTLVLSAPNNYNGLTSVLANTLQLNRTGGGTLPAANNILVGGTGTLKVSSDQTLNNLTLNAGGSIVVDNGVTLTINGTFFHNANAGAVTLTGSGKIVYGPSGTLTYGAASAQVTDDEEFPAVSGPFNLTINNTNGVSLHAARSISGALTFATGNIFLGTNNLTIASASGYTTTSHVVTDNTGKLIFSAIGATPVVFPIGADATTINPVAIFNGTGINYGARVVTGFPYPIYIGNNAVNRTWFVEAATTPAATINVNFFYSAGHGNPGFNYTTTVEHGVYTMGWNINQTGLTPAGSYQVTTLVSSFLGGTELPMVIGNLGSILSVSRSAELIVQKHGGNALLNWTLNTASAVKGIAVEKSADGRLFETVATVAPFVKTFTDNTLKAGTSYYRIKISDVNGKIFYSSIAAIINNDAGFEMISLLPNIVTTGLQVNVAAAKKTTLHIVITDAAGRPVSKTVHTVIAGSNLVNIDASRLSAGAYYATGTTAQGEVRTLRFVKQ